MKISYSWLKDYLNTSSGAEEISEILTAIGLEVEGFSKIETIKGGLAGVVVGHVLTCEKHPDADKLSITTVDLGDGVPTQIVCGAPNVAAGQKVLVATNGAVLYPVGSEEPFKIKKSKIRGAESNGMICAEDELGIGTSHAGIMVLPADAVAGTPAKDFLKIEEDFLIEIGLTPNRVDAASHYGVARDLAAYLKSNGKDAVLSRPSVENFAADNTSNSVKVEVKNSEACPRYMGVTVSGVTVQPSPEWLQNRLRAIGIAPKNNIVDITNYLLHAVGQPLHAFDADKIEGGKVVVRTCDEGTPFTTLDGVERKLGANDLMICSAQRPMCIAGVFGGEDSGVTETTKNVFIESAYFNPVWVRKTAKAHGLNTDSSFRYERGTDPNMPPYALKLAALMMKEFGGGSISSEIVDIYPEKVEPFAVDVHFNTVNKLIGKEIPKETVRAIVKSLEMEIAREMNEFVSLRVPPYRVDVRREADVIEEILRIYGYNNIDIPQHVNSTLTYAIRPDKDKVQNVVSDLLSANGFYEIMSNSLTKASYYDGLTTYPAERCVKIVNPLSNDLNVMRQTLLFNALEAAQLNVNRRATDLKLYEFGNCYYYASSRKEQGGLAPDSERQNFAMLMTGLDHAPSWNVKAAPTNFFTLKAAVEKILGRFGIDIYQAQVETLESELYSEAVVYTVRGKRLFEIGKIAKKLRSQFDIKSEVYFMEMNFSQFLQIIKTNKLAVKELAKYPEVRRDLALLIDRGVSFSQLKQIAEKTEKKLLKRVSLFDVYEGDKLPEGKKSYALGFVLQDETQTMTDAMTDRVMNNFIEQFEKQVGAEIRK